MNRTPGRPNVNPARPCGTLIGVLVEVFEADDADLNKVVSPALAAEATGYPLATLRQWANRPHTGITRYPDGYRLSELRAWLVRRNARMIRQRAA